MTSSRPRPRLFIDGEFVDSASGKTISVINPSTEAPIAEIPAATAAETDAAVLAAETAQIGWAKLPAIERALHLRELAALVRANASEIARILCEEQGKIRPLAEVEANFTADYIDFMAEYARRYKGEIIQSDRKGENIFLFKKPIGVIAGILPWNFPFFLIARKLAPALVTGNTIVVKPSSETPLNAFKFAELVAQSSLPKGVFNLVSGAGSVVGNALAANPRVGMVSLTGSVEGGVAVMRAAAENVTKVSLELGGKAPAIVTPSADIDLAVSAIRASRIINSGQVCNCAERVYVHESVAAEFTDKITRAMARTTIGDVLGKEEVEMGPLVSRTQQELVAAAVERALADGARVETGGKPIAGTGYFFQPTVLTNCRQESDIMRKEIFGPVLPISTYHDLDEAISKANDCEYGLTSSIYARDLDTVMRAANELKFGETYVNRENFEAMQGFHAGWRKSGIGGADGDHGLEEYLQTHVVYLNHDPNRA